jgi:hypothetical protein
MIVISDQDLNAILFLVPEKTRRNPRSGFMVQDLTLFRIG